MEFALKKDLKKLLRSQPLPYWKIAKFMVDNSISVPQVIQQTGALKSTVYYIWNVYWGFKTANGKKDDDLKWLEDNGYCWSIIKQLGQCKGNAQRKRVINALKKEDVSTNLTVKRVNELIKAAAMGNINKGLKINRHKARHELENQYVDMTGTPFQKLSDKQLKEMRRSINKYLDTLD